MEAIRFNEVVSKNGLFINFNKIKRFENKKVEIIILPAENDDNKKEFMGFAGSLPVEDFIDMQKSIEECRQVDKGTW